LRPKQLMAVLLACTIAAALAGCGGGSKQDYASVKKEYINSFNSAQTQCGEQIASLARSEGSFSGVANSLDDCADSLQAIKAPNAQVQSVQDRLVKLVHGFAENTRTGDDKTKKQLSKDAKFAAIQFKSEITQINQEL